MAAHHFYKIKNVYKMAFLVNNTTQKKTCLLSFFIQAKLAQNSLQNFKECWSLAGKKEK